MRKKLGLLIIFLSVLVIGLMSLLMFRQEKAPVLVSRTDPPKIQMEEESHDLGNVAEGVEIPHIFVIHNVGGEPLIIKDVTTSCGCTLLNLKDKFIAPGKSGELEVIMDTAMKQGFVRKEIKVFSNDPDVPKKSIFLSATVIPTVLPKITPMKPADPHMGLTERTKAKIFTGNCATCHVSAGKGKWGGDLFMADCAMCHGRNGEGKEGPALIPGNYDDPDYVARIHKVVRFGSETHLSMPGFLKAAGGPLTEGEINSIILYLQNKSRQAREEGAAEPLVN